MKNSDKQNTIDASFKKDRVLLFGANGQLGHDLLNRLKDEYDVTGIVRDDCDVTDIASVEQAIVGHKPGIIINCVAYNKVEDAENNVELAYAVNAFAPYHMAKLANSIGAIFVHVSTDYVFDGTKGSAYLESDPTCPINVYGLSKRDGEELALLAVNECYVFRTSGLYGLNSGGGKGYNFVTRMLRSCDGEVQVVDDQFVSPTYTVDLADAIYGILKRRAPFGVYHAVNDGLVSWCDFTKLIFGEMKCGASVVPITTSASPTKIRRPRNTGLSCAKLNQVGIVMPSTEDALRRYLQELNKRV